MAKTRKAKPKSAAATQSTESPARVRRTANKSQNVHVTGTADSRINSNGETGVNSPETDPISEKDVTSGENSPDHDVETLAGARGDGKPAHSKRPWLKDRQLLPGQPFPGCKLNDALQEKICGFIAAALTWNDACQLVGISRSAAWEWRTRGAAYLDDPVGHVGDARFGSFLEAVELAKTRSKAILIRKIIGSDDWRAAKWLLCNRFPSEYKDQFEISGPEGQPLSIGGNQFNVIMELPDLGPLEWKTVDHRSDEQKSGQSLADVIAHKPSQPIEDPVAKIVDFTAAAQNYDPLSSHKIGGNAYIKPKH